MLSKKNKVPYSLFSKLLHVKSKKISGKNVNARMVSLEDASLDSRFSFVVSVKISKLAVVRNKLKRYGYRAIKNNLIRIKPGYCLFFYFKKGSSSVDYEGVESDIVSILDNFGLLYTK